MKKSISFLLTLLLLFSLSACGSENNKSVTNPSAEQSTPTESPDEIPQETLSAIQRELHEYFYGYDGNSTISVSDYDGALDVSLNYEGMVLRVPFPDYANALAVRSKELANEYGEDIYRISVQFTGGQGKSLAWESYDGISGNLTDTYEETISLSEQTIDDLVERYGCMNWFYPLSEPKSIETPAPSDSSDIKDDIPPVGPVGGEGSFSLDATIGVLSGTVDGDAVYDPEANCIIVTVSADGLMQGFISAYVDDSAAAVEHWGETRSNYHSLDGSIRKLVSTSCDSEVDTMFAVLDNEQEYKYVMLFQNGELTHSLIDDFISQQES